VRALLLVVFFILQASLARSAEIVVEQASEPRVRFCVLADFQVLQEVFNPIVKAQGENWLKFSVETLPDAKLLTERLNNISLVKYQLIETTSKKITLSLYPGSFDQFQYNHGLGLNFSKKQTEYLSENELENIYSEIEENNNFYQANHINEAYTIFGELNSLIDQDYYIFKFDQVTYVEISRTHRTSFQPELAIYDVDFNLLALHKLSEAALALAPLEAGKYYYLALRDSLGANAVQKGKISNYLYLISLSHQR